MSVHNDFWSLFSAATPVPIIHANQNAPRPPKPYIDMRLTMGVPYPVHHGRVSDDGVRAISSHRDVTVQLQVYGDGSWGIAEGLALSLSKESLIDLSETLNISINDQVRIQDVPMLLDTATYESRAILDLQATYTASVIDDVGFIETVRGEGVVDDLPPQAYEATVSP